MENNETEIKALRTKSYIGLTIFTVSIIGAYFKLNHPVYGLISIIGLIAGWLIFSTNHTKITSIKLRQITNEYLQEKFKKKS